MADLAGRLHISLRRTASGMDVDIRSSRPVSASRVFIGKGVDETTEGLPALFSVCATAQAAACSGACEAALGLIAAPRTVRLRGLLVDAETVREHLWRLLLDWPRFLGAGPDGAAMGQVLRAFSRLRSLLSGGTGSLRSVAPDPELDLQAALDCLEELIRVSSARVLGQSPDAWLARAASADGLREWARQTDTVAARMLLEVDSHGWGALGRSQVPALPPLQPVELESWLAAEGADAFVAAPVWDGVPAESSPYSRNRGRAAVAGLARELGNGLLPRLAAQLVELASLQVRLLSALGTLDSEDPMPDPGVAGGLIAGVGIAQVQAARGLLVHRVAVRGDRVAEYRILAPTEWNFHPRGAVAAGLAAMPDADDDTLRRLAGLFVTAVDPCVDYDVAIA